MPFVRLPSGDNGGSLMTGRYRACDDGPVGTQRQGKDGLHVEHVERPSFGPCVQIRVVLKRYANEICNGILRLLGLIGYVRITAAALGSHQQDSQ
jgi:hypothetical protein